MDQWYYAQNRQRFGPVPMAQLKQLAAGGQLQPTDMVMQQGTGKWAAANTVPGLFPGAAPAPAAPPPPRPAAAPPPPRPAPAPAAPAPTAPPPPAAPPSGPAEMETVETGPQATGGGKSKMVAWLLSWLLGWAGADRFYLGYTGLGILKLLTCGGCLIWWWIDWFLIIINKLPDAQGNRLE